MKHTPFNAELNALSDDILDITLAHQGISPGVNHYVARCIGFELNFEISNFPPKLELSTKFKLI